MNVVKPAAVSAAVVAALLGVSAWAWPHSPPVLATHWGAGGGADGWSPRAPALLALPGLAAASALLFAGLPLVMPRKGRLERSAGAYVRVWIAVLLLLALVHVAVVATAVGAAVDVGRLVGAAAGALLIVLGDLLGKVRFNYVFGVRTPWTLASERVWDKTHRAVGPWFMLWGAAMAAAAFFAGPDIRTAVAIAGAAAKIRSVA